MSTRQTDSRKNNHRPLKNHECNLIVRKLSIEPALQLSETVRRSNKDEECGERECEDEKAEEPCGADAGVG